MNAKNRFQQKKGPNSESITGYSVNSFSLSNKNKSFDRNETIVDFRARISYYSGSLLSTTDRNINWIQWSPLITIDVLQWDHWAVFVSSNEVIQLSLAVPNIFDVPVITCICSEMNKCDDNSLSHCRNQLKSWIDKIATSDSSLHLSFT